MSCFVGVDIGTTGIRAGVYDDEFALLGTGSGRSIIRKGSNNEVIQEPEEIYRETAAAVNAAMKASKIDKKSVKSISFDGQMAGIMGIDKAWGAVTPYDSWLDTRCSDQVALLSRSAKQAVIEKTGNIPSYNHGPKIMWWKENEPEIFERTASFIQPAAYVAGRLCGLSGDEAFTDWTYLHFSGFADNRNLRWDDDLLRLFDVPKRKLPGIVSPFSIVGTAKKDAGLFGLGDDVSVAAGCGDTISCFLGTGAVEAGIAVDVAGTASVFALTVGQLVTDLDGLVFSARSVLEELWYSLSYINGGGLNLEWYRDMFAATKSFEELDDEAGKTPPGSEGLIFNPHLEGRGYPNNPGMRGQWRDFTRSHKSGHFYRSVLEGIAFEYALYMERIVELTGGTGAYKVRGVAGGAGSDVWNQIKADVLGCEYCTINRKDISILGQAVVAAVASGYVSNLVDTVKDVVSVEKVFSPDISNHEMYRESIARYKNLLDQYGPP